MPAIGTEQSVQGVWTSFAVDLALGMPLMVMPLSAPVAQDPAFIQRDPLGFSSLHTSVGLAFVGAVVGDYLGSVRGLGHLILQVVATFDVNTVFAGIVVLIAFALRLDGLVGKLEKRPMK